MNCKRGDLFFFLRFPVLFFRGLLARDGKSFSILAAMVRRVGVPHRMLTSSPPPHPPHPKLNQIDSKIQNPKSEFFLSKGTRGRFSGIVNIVALHFRATFWSFFFSRERERRGGLSFPGPGEGDM